MNQDTKQQKAILRQSKSARAARKKFPVGAHVTSADHEGLPVGVVVRHVPGSSAQGGVIVVQWPNGQIGRHGPITLRVVN
jgi:hypothetical protein